MMMMTIMIQFSYVPDMHVVNVFFFPCTLLFFDLLGFLFLRAFWELQRSCDLSACGKRMRKMKKNRVSLQRAQQKKRTTRTDTLCPFSSLILSLSCLILSYLISSYLIFSYLILSCPVLSYPLFCVYVCVFCSKQTCQLFIRFYHPAL